MSADIINFDPFALAREAEPAPDPIFDLIAEQDRLRSIGIDYRSRADEAMYALSKEEQERLREQHPEEEDLPEPAGSGLVVHCTIRTSLILPGRISAGSTRSRPPQCRQRASRTASRA